MCKNNLSSASQMIVTQNATEKNKTKHQIYSGYKYYYGFNTMQKFMNECMTRSIESQALKKYFIFTDITIPLVTTLIISAY